MHERTHQEAAMTPPQATATVAPRGLKNLLVADTQIGDVRGEEGFYHYRQYSAIELCEKRTLEDVWYLMLEGRLPSLAERETFIKETAPLREIPPDVAEALPVIAHGGDRFIPLDALRTAVSLTAYTLDFKPVLDCDAQTLRANALHLCALTPTLLTALYRLNRGERPVPPHPKLPYGANYLYMLTGAEPEPRHARAIEQYLTSTIDHGFNASTFTARVITSTGADVGAAITGAIGALSGPLHGGAPSRALEMLDLIGDPDNADAWIRDAVRHGKRIMGFGHRVYRTEDPRAIMLRRVAEELGGDIVEFAERVERTVVDVLAELKPGRRIYTNVEFYAGVVMELCGIPRRMFTPTFASSRVVGWTAHLLEQIATNKMLRPTVRYVGARGLQVPMPSM